MCFARSFSCVKKGYDPKLGIITKKMPYSKVLSDCKNLLKNNSYILDETNMVFNELQAKKNDIDFTITFVVIDDKNVEIEIIAFSETNKKSIKKEVKILHDILS